MKLLPQEHAVKAISVLLPEWGGTLDTAFNFSGFQSHHLVKSYPGNSSPSSQLASFSPILSIVSTGDTTGLFWVMSKRYLCRHKLSSVSYWKHAKRGEWVPHGFLQSYFWRKRLIEIVVCYHVNCCADNCEGHVRENHAELYLIPFHKLGYIGHTSLPTEARKPHFFAMAHGSTGIFCIQS